MTLPSSPHPAPQDGVDVLSASQVEVLRQAFFGRVLSHIASPMDFINLQNRVFPV